MAIQIPLAQEFLFPILSIMAPVLNGMPIAKETDI
jgi:hypothetical protein